MLPAVTGGADAIDRIATTYGVYHEAQEGSAVVGYLVIYAATLMFVDRVGYLKLVLPFKGTAEEVADDLSHFLS